MQKNFFNKDRKNKKMIIAISVSVAIIVIGLAVFCYFLFANEKENNAKNKAENAQEDPQAKIEEEIVTMPNYFADYDTTVHFISEEELKANHSGIPHGGFVFRSGITGWNGEHKHIIEYSLKLDSNPEFTSSVIVAYARAINRLHKEGVNGCKTVFDIAPAYLSKASGEELRAHLL